MKYPFETLGGAVAALDYDNDGWVDLLFLNGAPSPGARAHAIPPASTASSGTPAEGRFVDVTLESGLSGAGIKGYPQGVAVGDYDNDGYVGRPGHELRRQRALPQRGQRALHGRDRPGGRRDAAPPLEGERGLPGFRQRRLAGPLRHPLLPVDPRRERGRLVRPAAEGAPHLLRPGRLQAPAERAPAQQPRRHVHRRLRPRSASTGTSARGWASPSPTTTATGGWTSSSPTTGCPTSCTATARTGSSREVAFEAGVAANETGAMVSGMGCDFKDFDDDGWPDIFLTDLVRDIFTLFVNQGKGFFLDRTFPSGIGAASVGHSGWSKKFLDIDNDGCEGHLRRRLARGRQRRALQPGGEVRGGLLPVPQPRRGPDRGPLRRASAPTSTVAGRLARGGGGRLRQRRHPGGGRLPAQRARGALREEGRSGPTTGSCSISRARRATGTASARASGSCCPRAARSTST